MKFDVPSVVMEKLFENGYEDQIVDIAMAFENDSSKEVSDIPLSPISIRNSDQYIVLNADVLKEYKKLVERINNPKTAGEIPFYLLGNSRIVNGQNVILIEKIIYLIDDNLDDLRVSIDEQKFKELLMDSNYSIISIGHTHGNISEEKKKNTITELLPSDIREKYSIRDVGLNLSIADIWQHEAFKSIASQISNKKVLQTIIMYNGDFVTIDDGSISKSNNVQAINQENEIIDIPCCSEQILCRKHK